MCYKNASLTKSSKDISAVNNRPYVSPSFDVAKALKLIVILPHTDIKDGDSDNDNEFIFQFTPYIFLQFIFYTLTIIHLCKLGDLCS